MDNPGKAVKKAARRVMAIDQAVTHRVATVRKHPAMQVIATLAEGADQPPLLVLSAGTLAVGLATRRADLARGGARMLLAHLVATGVKLAIKHRVDRSRPGHAIEHGHRFEPGDTGGHEEKSFPSGHTAGAVAVARAASRDIPGVAAPPPRVTVAVAAAQAPAGNHYLTDVVAGALVGWASEAVVSALFDRWAPKVAPRLFLAAPIAEGLSMARNPPR